MFTTVLSRILSFFMTVIMIIAAPVNLFTGNKRAAISTLEDDCRLIFAAISDTHIDEKTSFISNTMLKTGLRDMQRAKDRLDAVVFDGDITNHGYFKQWDMFAESVSQYNFTDNICLVVGNHDTWGPNRDDFTNPVDGVLPTFIKYNKEISGREIDNMYYSDIINGYYFIMLGSEEDHTCAYLSDAQLEWFAEELKKAQKQLDADGWEGVVVLAYDGIIPQAAEFADLPAELETFNHFAEVVENMPSREKQLPKFKAVLRICQCSSVNQAISLAERLEHFYFDARIRNYADLVYDELENVIGDRQAEELLQCLDIEKYGRILQQGYNAEFTEYGMVTRDDFQTMDAPWQEESEVMDMQIT